MTIDIACVHLTIDPDGIITLDIQVGDQWRRVLRAFHAGYTDYYLSGGSLELGGATKDVTSEYNNEDEEVKSNERKNQTTLE